MYFLVSRLKGESEVVILAYTVKLVSLDLKKAYDMISFRAIRAACKAWGLVGHKFAILLNASLNWRCKVVGLRASRNSAVYQQYNGLGTGAPEIPAIFTLTFAWFLVVLRKFEIAQLPQRLLDLGRAL